MFFDLVSEVAERCKRIRPPFAGSYLLDPSMDEIVDQRENRYARTELRSVDGGSSREYMVDPSEFSMDTTTLESIMKSISGLETNPPASSVMEDESRLRRYVEKRVMRDLSGTDTSGKKADPRVLSRICAQYTVGFGVIEHLMRDERVQDIYIGPPYDSNPVRVTVGGMSKPELEGGYPTNILLEPSEVERMVSILRFTSGRPFTEADPVLECDISNFNARATAVSPPLSPGGISIAIRKHSHDPWTLLRLVNAGSLDCRSSAFLDLCIDGRSTMLIAGPRGAGKSSLLGSLLFDVDPAQRIITIEDTPELPIDHLSNEGYNVLGLTVDSDGKNGADKALRTALRLGESVLVLGEVRGPETKTLYEAMSAGTAGSAVLGTFHADSAASVYKRAVEDLGVSSGSFSATDIVVVCGLVQPRGRRVRYRRVVQIAEYIKTGDHGRFNDLFVYDPRAGCLKESADLSSSITIRRISSIWGMSRSEVMDELDLRTRVFDISLKKMDRETAGRPSSMMRVLDTLREAKESDPSSPLREWMRRFDREEEEWVI